MLVYYVFQSQTGQIIRQLLHIDVIHIFRCLVRSVIYVPPPFQWFVTISRFHCTFNRFPNALLQGPVLMLRTTFSHNPMLRPTGHLWWNIRFTYLPHWAYLIYSQPMPICRKYINEPNPIYTAYPNTSEPAMNIHFIHTYIYYVYYSIGTEILYNTGSVYGRRYQGFNAYKWGWSFTFVQSLSAMEPKSVWERERANWMIFLQVPFSYDCHT